MPREVHCTLYSTVFLDIKKESFKDKMKYFYESWYLFIKEFSLLFIA